MKTSQRGADLIKQFEGFRASAYQDVAGVWTIGYGFTQGVKEGDTITQEEADDRLVYELRPFEVGVLNACAFQANQNQFDAMVSLAYNIGLENFRQSTVLKDHNAKDYAGAAQAFGMWDMAGGKVVVGLVKRRYEESQLYSKEA